MRGTSGAVEGDWAKGLAAGVAAGLVASLAMELFQRTWQALAPQSGPGGEEPATVKAAEAVSRGLGARPLPERVKGPASEAVHFATGAALGAAYGMLAEVAPAVTASGGTAYGAATWLVLDEAAVPLAGLSKSPAGVPAAMHLYGLASHLVFGATLEATRLVVRDLLDLGQAAASPSDDA